MIGLAPEVGRSRDEIALLETFADQAVIAIENARLFPELQGVRWNSKRRRAKSCGVIASSPTDAQPVLDIVAQMRAALCGASMHHLV